MVSVIMLTYNRKKFVRNMIDDILNQSYRNFEFVIVDNGSNDGTGEILDIYKRADTRIKVITMDCPQSIGKGRNVGLKNASGDLVAFVDDDDRVEHDFLEFLVTLLEENNADISMCGATEGDGVTKQPQCLFEEKMYLSGEEAMRLLLERKYIRAGMPTKLYKKKILERYPFVENCKNEDIHTQYKYLLASKAVVIYGLDKYYITRHASNVSGFTSNAAAWDAQTMWDYLHAFHNRTDFIKKNAPNSYKCALYSEWSFMISMIEKIDRFYLKDCGEIQEYLIHELQVHKEEFLNMPEIKAFEKDWIERYI